MSRQVSPDGMGGGGWRKNFRSANKEIALPRLVLCWDFRFDWMGENTRRVQGSEIRFWNIIFPGNQ